MKKSIIIYGMAVAVILILLKWLDYGLFARVISFEIYMGVIAALFTTMGIWMGLRMTNPPKEKNEKDAQEQKLVVDILRESGISNREYEVMQHMAKGLSNQEIADQLFISLSTVKTHTSRLFEKLDAKRRTQVIHRGKEIGLL